MARPLIEPARDARHVHGQDGLADLDLPRSRREPVEEHAVELLRRTLLAAPAPVTLIPLAPLKNIAVLLRTYPEVIPTLERIVLMGGSVAVANATAGTVRYHRTARRVGWQHPGYRPSLCCSDAG